MNQYFSKLLFIVSSFTIMLSNAQTPYYYGPDGTHGAINDPNWNTVSLKLNEEFNNETSTKTKWNYFWLGSIHRQNSDCFYLEGDNCQDNYQSCTPYDFTSNHNHTYITSIGSMTLTTRFESPVINTYYTSIVNNVYSRAIKSYSVSTGVAISKMAYKYGFFEARFKVNRSPGTQCKGLGHCFWLYADYNNGHPISGVPARQTDYSEIDIAENDPMRGLMTSNVWYRKNPNSNPNYFDYWERQANDCDRDNVHIHDAYVQQDQWHTYSLEWTPTEMNTYYDNFLIRHMEYPADKLDHMNVVLDIEGALLLTNDKARFCKVIQQGVTNLPFNFELDFVRIYSLNMEGCSTSFSQTNYDFGAGTYTYNVKKNITLGQTSSTTASVKISGQNVSLRAVEYISLEDGFEVDGSSNTEFFATTNGTCDN